MDRVVEHSSLITTVKFHGLDVKDALVRSAKAGLEALWLMRSNIGIYLTSARQDFRYYPQSVSSVLSGLLSPKPQPYVEVLPHHNCVLSALSRIAQSDLHRVWLEIQFNDLQEYRMYLAKPPKQSDADAPVRTSVPDDDDDEDEDDEADLPVTMAV